jgi:hypothetical protein
LSFTAIALAGMFAAWSAAGFVAWLPWVAFNGQDRPLTRLGVAVAAGLAGALLLPAIGVRGETGLVWSPAAAFAMATAASFAYHRHLRRARRQAG